MLHLRAEDWRSKTRCYEDLYAPQSSLDIRRVALPAREILQQPGSAHTVSHDADREVQPPQQFGGGQFGQGTLECTYETSGHVFQMFFINVLDEFAGFGVQAAHKGTELPGVAARDFQNRPEKGIQQRVKGQWPVSGICFASVQHSEAFLIHRTHAAADNRSNQCLLGLEVVVNGCQIDVSFGSDRSPRSGLEAVAGKKAVGGVEDSIFSAHTFV